VCELVSAELLDVLHSHADLDVDAGALELAAYLAEQADELPQLFRAAEDGAVVGAHFGSVQSSFQPAFELEDSSEQGIGLGGFGGFSCLRELFGNARLLVAMHGGVCEAELCGHVTNCLVSSDQGGVDIETLFVAACFAELRHQ
jgi:hypothetical protein